VKAVPSSPAGSRRAKDASATSASGAADGTPAATVMPPVRQAPPPGPLEMDLSSDDDNMSVDEKVTLLC
jgi:hypothetical protein